MSHRKSNLSERCITRHKIRVVIVYKYLGISFSVSKKLIKMEEELKNGKLLKKEVLQKTKCQFCSGSFFRIDDHIKNIHDKINKC